LYPQLEKTFAEMGKGRGSYVLEEIAASTETLNDKQKELNERIENRQLDAYVVIGKNVVTSPVQYKDSPDHKIRYYCRNVGDIAQSERIKGAIRRAVINVRLEKAGINPEKTAKASRNIAIDDMEVKGGTAKKSQKMSNIFGAFAFMMLLFMALQLTAQGLLHGVIEEKNSRVIEVLLSSVSPKELMIGKILGLGAVGLTVVLLWSIVGYSAARARDINIASLPNVGFFVLFFLLGYAFFGIIMSAAGSVCNSEKEAQQMMMPVMLLLVIPLVVWFYIAQRPDGTLAKILSVIPFTVPMVMMLRIALQMPPAAEIALSIVIMLVSIPVALWAATRIFRTGILMYGKRPRLKEIVRWVRYK